MFRIPILTLWGRPPETTAGAPGRNQSRHEYAFAGPMEAAADNWWSDKLAFPAMLLK